MTAFLAAAVGYVAERLLPRRAHAWDVKVRASSVAHNFVNPIRAIVDQMKLDPHPEKELIRLSIGGPLHVQHGSKMHAALCIRMLSPCLCTCHAAAPASVLVTALT